MNFKDVVIPALGFIIIIRKIYVAKGLWYKFENLSEIIIGLVVMAFSIWFANDASTSSASLNSDIQKLIIHANNDSVSNSAFQIYLKDSFGIERRGNLPVIINKNTYNLIDRTKPKELGIPDSLNYYYYTHKDSLFISPKEGAWVHGYVALDTGKNDKQGDYINEGMGTANLVDKIAVNGKIYETHIWRIYNRSTYKDDPISINKDIYGKKRYIIFGEEGNLSKRYFYKNGIVTWIPRK